MTLVHAHTHTNTDIHALMYTLYIHIIHYIFYTKRGNSNKERLLVNLSSSNLFLKIITKIITLSASCSRFHLKSNKKKINIYSRGKAHQLRVLAGLTEDLNSISSTQVRLLTNICNSSSRGSNHTCRKNIFTKNKEQ